MIYIMAVSFFLTNTQGPQHRPDASFSPSPTSIFRSSSRLSLASSMHFQPMDRYNHRDQSQPPMRYDDFLSFSGSSSLLNSSSNVFNLSENNPLLTQDHRVIKPYNASSSPGGRSHTPASTSFRPINYSNEPNNIEAGGAPESSTASSIKVESHLCDIIHPTNSQDLEDSTFTPTNSWTRSTMGMDEMPTDLSRDGTHT